MRRIVFNLIRRVLIILRIDRCTSESGYHKDKPDYSKPFMKFEVRGKQYGTTMYFVCKHCKKERSTWVYLTPH